MTVACARTRTGARIALRTLICGLGAALILTGSGCGSTTVSNGTPVMTVTDTTGQFSSYLVTLSGITFTRNDGAILAPPQFTPELIDFTQLNDLSELLGAPGLGVGTYTSMSLTLDYSAAYISVDVNGQPQKATLVDTSGATPTAIGMTVKFDPDHPLVINQSKSTPLALDFDLTASNVISINSSTSAVTVTVKPFFVASAKPTDAKTVRARGDFLTTNTGDNNFIINIRPFHDVQSYLSASQGALTVQTNAQTYFNVNGTVYTGSQGLAAMTSLPQNTLVAAFGSIGDLSTVTPVFNATSVYAGTSLESVAADHISGIVTARTGNTLTVHGGTFVTRLGVASFQTDTTVTVGTSTIVTEDGQAGVTANSASISVGQRIDAIGQASLDANNKLIVDATQGIVRLAPTHLWGTLKSATAGRAYLALQSLEVYDPAAFNFAGTGANPTNYAVGTGTVDVTANLANTPLRADGFVTPFGSASPPDFAALAVTPAASLEQTLVVEWVNGGATHPFTTGSALPMTVDLGNANLGSVHQIRSGPNIMELTTLSGGSPSITVANVDPNTIQLALGNAAKGISEFHSSSGFTTALGTLLNGTNAVSKLVAVGHYDGTTNTFNASRINVVQQ